jgi:hypothetical protein
VGRSHGSTALNLAGSRQDGLIWGHGEVVDSTSGGRAKGAVRGHVAPNSAAWSMGLSMTSVA